MHRERSHAPRAPRDARLSRPRRTNLELDSASRRLASRDPEGLEARVATERSASACVGRGRGDRRARAVRTSAWTRATSSSGADAIRAGRPGSRLPRGPGLAGVRTSREGPAEVGGAGAPVDAEHEGRPGPEVDPRSPGGPAPADDEGRQRSPAGRVPGGQPGG